MKLFSSLTPRSKRHKIPRISPQKPWLNCGWWLYVRSSSNGPKEISWAVLKCLVGKNSNLTMEVCKVEMASKEKRKLKYEVFLFFFSIVITVCCLFNSETQGLHFQKNISQNRQCEIQYIKTKYAQILKRLFETHFKYFLRSKKKVVMPKLN